MSDDRRRDIEHLIKMMKAQNNADTRGLIPEDLPLGRQAFQARNLTEEALAQEVFKNTGIPIPNEGASRLEREDFLSRLVRERYPEFKDVDLRLDENIKGVDGFYAPNSKRIGIQDRGSLRHQAATAFHEAAHQYDDEVLNYNMPKRLRTGDNAKSQLDIERMYDYAINAMDTPDPTNLYEKAAKGHHARIPDVRDANSFGLGALKSYLKSGNFKSLAGPVAGIGIGAAMMPDDASAADFIPGLDQAENAGSAMDDKMMQTEVKARQNYDQSQARKDALMRLKNGR